MRDGLNLILGTSVFFFGLYFLSALNAFSYIDPEVEVMFCRY